jgi:putative transposase
MEVKSNRNVVYNCTYYVVWCPKYRLRLITSFDPALSNPPIEGDSGPVDERLVEIIKQVCKETGGNLIKVEVMSDHVHLLVGINPQFGINRLVKRIKGRSSYLLRQEFPSLKRRAPTFWTNSYFVATVGGAPLGTIKQYIANQRYV